MHRSDFIYTAILLPLDYLMLIAAGLTAYAIRKTAFVKNLDVVSSVFYELPTGKLLTFILIMAAIGIVFFSFAGLYNSRENRKFINQVNKVFLAATATIAAVIIFLYFKREFLFSSRFIILISWALAILFVITERGTVRAIRRILLHYAIGGKRALIVGQDQNTNRFLQELPRRQEWGYKIIGRVTTKEQLLEKLKHNKIDEVIFTDLNYSKEKINDFVAICQTNHLDFRYSADNFSAYLHNIEMDELAGFPFVEIKRTPLQGWGRVKKRSLDIIGSVFALVILFIPSIIIAIIIKLTSTGPIFVKLTRVGENGKLFKIYKFRSMIKGAQMLKKELLPLNNRQGPLFKMKDDPRITAVGKVLRLFSLDEFPNFFNVLLGNMSLVGPRPHEPEEVSRYKDYQRRLLNIKPGITGVAQISGRSSLDFSEEAQLDLYYVENWSLKADITILLKTPFTVLWRRDEAA